MNIDINYLLRLTKQKLFINLTINFSLPIFLNKLIYLVFMNVKRNNISHFERQFCRTIIVESNIFNTKTIKYVSKH